MAAEFVGGAALGAVFGELLKAALEAKDKATMFKTTMARLQATLQSIAPMIKEIEQYNNVLDRPKQEIESLIRLMEEGKKLIHKCSSISGWRLLSRVHYMNKIIIFEVSLVKFFNVDLQAQMARDQKETLLEVKKIHATMVVRNDNNEDRGKEDRCGTISVNPAQAFTMDVRELNIKCSPVFIRYFSISLSIILLFWSIGSWLRYKITHFLSD